MKSKFFFLAAALPLAACSALPQGHWEKEGVSLAQLTTDRSGCASHVRMGDMPARVERDLLQLCMQAKGYHLAPADDPGPPDGNPSGSGPRTAGIDG